MRALLKLCLAFLAASMFAMSASAAVQKPPVVERTMVSNPALTLAKILHSDTNIIGNDRDDEKAISLGTELMGSKEDIADLETEHPGISMEMMRAALPSINRHLRTRLPQLWQQQAALYDEILTAEEITHLVSFYSSPTGQKMVAAMFRHIKPTAMAADAKSSADLNISPGAVLKDIRNTVPDIMSEMDDAGKAQMIATFSRPGLVPKMQVLAPKTQAITIKWMNETTPKEDQELEKIMTSVIERRQKSDVK